MEEIVSITLAGLVLGVTHALDADHIAAVSTIVSEKKKVVESAALGVIWGFGHTATLLIAVVGMLALGFKLPELILENAEIAVGIMLLVLGALSIKKGLSEKLHTHEHQHGSAIHTHIHQHIFEKGHEHSHEKRSLLVGIVHGLAGSAALMLVVASSASGLADGVRYVLAFGIGTTIGMAGITAIMAIPVSLMAKANRIGFVQMVFGAFSIITGATIIGQSLGNLAILSG